MTDAERLTLVKADLQMTTSANDTFLGQLITFGKSALEAEGVVLTDTLECNVLICQYAAYLFRKRASSETEMPRFLRYGINQMLFRQKGGRI